MRKNALSICCFVCAFGAFGAFFRWLQNQIAVDVETGLQKASIWNFAVVLVIVAAVIAFRVFLGKRDDAKVYTTDMHDTFRGTTLVFDVAAWVIAMLFFFGGLLLIPAVRAVRGRGLYLVIAAVAMLTGLTFPSICNTSKKHFSPNLVCFLSSLPILLFCLWLISCYMEHASIPNRWTYCVEIICVCSVLIAFFYIAGYAFDSPRPFASLYTSMLGAFLCIMSLADGRYLGMQMMIVGTAAMLLMYCYMISSNMRGADAELDAVAKAAASVAADPQFADGAEDGEDTVIPSGINPDEPEPTRKA